MPIDKHANPPRPTAHFIMVRSRAADDSRAVDESGDPRHAFGTQDDSVASRAA
jgi:hypothetical protein